ncbi:MAG: ABC transporter permease [Gemmatimonadetes bacterium]|nr:ABC transporter permease [Gemmatimonadota bacterium]
MRRLRLPSAARRKLMREALVIARREFLERVRTKWFVVMTILGPILMVALLVIPALLAGRGAEGAKVDVIDQSGKLGPALVAALKADEDHWNAAIVDPAATDEQELARVRTKTINGFIRIPADGLTKGTFVYRGDNATNQSVGFTLQKTITGVVYTVRGAERGLSPPQLAEMLAPPQIRAFHTTGATAGESGGGTFILGYIIAFILYMVITLYGVNVMRSIVTEKSSRVVELMVAASKPRSMMTGKILGVGGVGLAQVAVWFLFGGIALAYRVEILQALGAGANAASVLPSLSMLQFGVIIAFFVLGYLFYSSLYAAIGATVSSEQDSQQAAVPITMFLVIGMVSMTAITGDPRGSTSAIMTLVPMWSPMLIPLRFILGGATPGEVALSLGILLVATLLVARAAAKIYRVGILMYGKRPGFGEMVRWLRY